MFLDATQFEINVSNQLLITSTRVLIMVYLCLFGKPIKFIIIFKLPDVGAVPLREGDW